MLAAEEKRDALDTVQSCEEDVPGVRRLRLRARNAGAQVLSGSQTPNAAMRLLEQAKT